MSRNPWNDHNRFQCPKPGQEFVLPEEKYYTNKLNYMSDIEKAEKCYKESV